MPNTVTIQKLSATYVYKLLISQPCGTYIVRSKRTNDEILSKIRITNRSSASNKRNYVILSVRVDEKLYPCPVMHYRLLYTEDNHDKLLEQYTSQKNKLGRLTPLKRELIIPTNENPNWILNSKQFVNIDFTRGRFNGKNNSGTSEALWKVSGQNDLKIFIKRFTKTSVYFNNELNILKQVSFFPITTLYGCYSDKQYNYLVLAHAGKSLESICPIQATTAQAKMCKIAKIAFQIANAMMYLENKNVVHRDLTAGNVLIDESGFIRVADFGHAIQKEEGKNNLTRSVTNTGEERFQIRFLAPECIAKPAQSRTNQSSIVDRKQIYVNFTSKSDVWSFGILLVQLMLENPSKPYPHIINDKDIPRRIVINREIHPQPNGCDVDMYYLLQQCWTYESANRISFTEIRDKMQMLTTIYS